MPKLSLLPLLIWGTELIFHWFFLFVFFVTRCLLLYTMKPFQKQDLLLGKIGGKIKNGKVASLQKVSIRLVTADNSTLRIAYRFISNL